ncbi:hypothetical protein D9M71_438890 [compost metagenome]
MAQCRQTGQRFQRRTRDAAQSVALQLQPLQAYQWPQRLKHRIAADQLGLSQIQIVQASQTADIRRNDPQRVTFQRQVLQPGKTLQEHRGHLLQVHVAHVQASDMVEARRQYR